jgi:hypothetical protein
MKNLNPFVNRTQMNADECRSKSERNLRKSAKSADFHSFWCALAHVISSQIVNTVKRLVTFLLLGKLSTAYLEPGSSSFLLKILISSLVALVVFFRQIWSYGRMLFGKLSGKRQVDQETAVAPAPAAQPENHS